MEMDLFKKIINELSEWEGENLKLLRLAMLGEPFINPEFCDMLQIAKEAEVADRVDTFSNGSLLTEDVAQKLIDYNLDVIRISIYAATQERHEKVSQTKVKISTIRDNVKRLREMRDAQGKHAPYIFVKMFDSFNEENDIFFKMYENIADRIGLEKVHNATNYSGNDLVNMYYNDAEKEKIANDDYKNSLNYGRIACSRPFMSMVINNIGDCLMCTHDPAKGTKIGDANNETLQELWQGEKMFQFRKMLLENRKHENPICKKCDWFKLFPEEDNVDGVDIEKLRP
jgi:radical SAM protein with 4Fe4S-binding SPASM domain